MWKRIRRVLGRPKTGQRFYSQSLSLTLEQKEFLKRCPNASELIRKILDDLVAKQSQFESEVESELKVLSVKYEIDRLKQEADRVQNELEAFLIQCQGSFWNPSLDENGTVLDKETLTRKPIIPKNTHEKYLLEVLRALKKERDHIIAKINELKEEVVKVVS